MDGWSRPRSAARARRRMAGAGGWCRAPPPAVDAGSGDHAMVLAERLAAGYGDDDLFVVGWREELGL